MVSRFAQIVNAFPRLLANNLFFVVGNTIATIRETGHFVHFFRILRNTDSSSRETQKVPQSIASSSVRIIIRRISHRGVARPRKTAAEGRVKNIVVDPPSRRMCAKRFAKHRRNFSLPPPSTNVISDHTLVNELPSASKCLLNQTFVGLYV